MPVPPPQEVLYPPPPPYPSPAATPTKPLNTDSGLGPGPGLIIHSPVGVIRYPVYGWGQTSNQGQWTNSEGTWVAPTVFKPLGNVNVVGVGDHTLTGLSVGGSSGTLDVVLTTGTAGGSPQHAAALADLIPTPTGYIAILLDTSNRPYAVVTNAAGTIVAQSTPSGPVLPSGVTLDVTLMWNSVTPFVSFTVGGQAQVFGTNPGTPWSSFAPNWLMVGDGFGANAAFAGTVGNAQVGNSP